MDATPTYYYLTDYLDEAVPCPPTLAGWAKWLSQPDENWNRDEGARDGDTFAVGTLEITGWHRIEIDGSGLPTAHPPIPENASFFAVVYSEGETGWHADDILCDPLSREEAFDILKWSGEHHFWIVAGRDGPGFTATYRVVDGQPRLMIEAHQ